jgi:hypothetical protein
MVLDAPADGDGLQRRGRTLRAASRTTDGVQPRICTRCFCELEVLGGEGGESAGDALSKCRAGLAGYAGSRTRRRKGAVAGQSDILNAYVPELRGLLPGPFFFQLGLPFPGGDQFPQTVLDVKAPPLSTHFVAFQGRDQALVREAELSLVVFPGDIEDHVRAVPLGLVLDKVEPAFRDMPYDLLAGHQFG